jgi:hypothetical protein
MKCTHCLDSFDAEGHLKQSYAVQPMDKSGQWEMRCYLCPSCGNYIFYLVNSMALNGSRMVYPKGISRTTLPEVVTDPYRSDYLEACLVLSDSPKASAALSRRCLQTILENKADVKKGNLDSEIQEILDSNKLPTHLAESIDAVRVIGNFAAHPIKSKSSGEIVEVEVGEAEWNLDVLEGLFDFYFIQPDILEKKKNALNQKLRDAGKPLLK